MSNNTRTVQVHTNNPVSSDELHDHIYHGVAQVNMEDALTLYDENDKPIAQYQAHAWASWNVVPDKPKSTGTHIHFDARSSFPRDHLGRFTKRK